MYEGVYEGGGVEIGVLKGVRGGGGGDRCIRGCIEGHLLTGHFINRALH